MEKTRLRGRQGGRGQFEEIHGDGGGGVAMPLARGQRFAPRQFPTGASPGCAVMADQWLETSLYI